MERRFDPRLTLNVVPSSRDMQFPEFPLSTRSPTSGSSLLAQRATLVPGGVCRGRDRDANSRAYRAASSGVSSLCASWTVPAAVRLEVEPP